MNSFETTLSLTAHALLLPVQAVVGFFAPWEKSRAAQAATSPGASAALILPTWRADSNRGAANQALFVPPAPVRSRHAVRVLRVVDASNPPCSAGRMVISGRISEVCAELERLSRQEATASNRSEIA